MFHFNDLTLLLVDSSLKSLVLLLFVATLIFFLRKFFWKRDNAEAEHRLWAFLMLSMVALPFVSLSVPDLHVPIAGFPELRELAPQDALVEQKFGIAGSSNPLASGPGNSALTNSQELVAEPNAFYREHELAPSRSPASDISQSLESQFNFPLSDLEFANVSSSNSIEDESKLTTSVVADAVSSNFEWRKLAAYTTVIWLIGSGVLLLRFALSICLGSSNASANARLVQCRRHGRASEVEPCCCSVIDIQSPVVIGWFRHAILLPACWQTWSREKLNSVLSHELAHVQRRDGLLSMLAELNSIMHWPNPVSWLAKFRLAHLAELACDEKAVSSTGDRTQYAKHLLEIASLNNCRGPRPGIPMASRSEIGDPCRADSAQCTTIG